MSHHEPNFLLRFHRLIDQLRVLRYNGTQFIQGSGNRGCHFPPPGEGRGPRTSWKTTREKNEIQCQINPMDRVDRVPKGAELPKTQV